MQGPLATPVEDRGPGTSRAMASRLPGAGSVSDISGQRLRSAPSAALVQRPLAGLSSAPGRPHGSTETGTVLR